MKSLLNNKLRTFSILFIVLFLFSAVITVLAPFVPRVFATNDFTVSNVTFNPATGYLEFDYTGTNITSSTPSMRIVNSTNANTQYWLVIGDSQDRGDCTSSHCWAVLAPRLTDSGVTTVKIDQSGFVSQDLNYPLPFPTSNTPQTVRYDTQLYTLTLSSGASTTTNTTASFGSVTLPVKSHVCVHSEWVLENDTSPLGITAILMLDSTTQPIFGDTVPLSASGIAFTIGRNHCFSNLAAGSHTLGVKIDQYPFRSGDTVRIREGSTMWITAYPTQ